MTAITETGLHGIVTSALERMAFVFAELDEATPADVRRRAVAHAEVELQGTVPLVVTVSATAGMVQEIAAGMTGVEHDAIDVDLLGQPTVAEMANVFGGELVMAEVDRGHQLRIGLPAERDADAVAARAARAVAQVVVGSDFGEMLVIVSCA